MPSRAVVELDSSRSGRAFEGSDVPSNFLVRCAAAPLIFVGVKSLYTCSLRGRELRLCVASLALPLRQSRFVGVASDEPDSLTLVRGSGVLSTHHKRPAGVAERFQCIEHPVSASSSEARDILSSDPTRVDLAHEPDVLGEQAGSLAFDPLAVGVGGAGVLAWRAAGNDLW
jgi:hypothetical protein